jgi:hypothetical protein
MNSQLISGQGCNVGTRSIAGIRGDREVRRLGFDMDASGLTKCMYTREEASPKMKKGSKGVGTATEK